MRRGPGRAWWPLLAAGAAAAVVAAVAAAEGGQRALGSVLMGAALAVVFLAGGRLPLLLLRGQEQGGAGLGLGVLLLNYALRLVLAGLVLVALGRSQTVEPGPTVAGLIAAALAWTAAQAVASLRPVRDPR